MVPLAHATSEGSDEPAHPHSLGRGINCSRTHRRNVDEGACLKLGGGCVQYTNEHCNNCLLSDKKKKCSKKRLVYD